MIPQEVLESQGQLEEPDKKAAAAVISMSDCIKTVTITLM